MVTAAEVLSRLPPFRDERVIVKKDQDVDDIINQILIAHKQYAGFYDKFALLFDDSTEKICNNISNFLKQNVKYVEEPDNYQTTALPAAIISWKEGDCKHYSLFTAGVLASIERQTGKKIKWNFRFCSYDLMKKKPHHVYVVVHDGDNELWIDPVPGANKLTPVWILDKQVKNSFMPLYNVIGNVNGGNNISNAVSVLLQYSLIFMDGQIDYEKYDKLIASLPYEKSQQLVYAMETLQDAIAKEDDFIGGFIQDLAEKAARAAAKFTLMIPRTAFLLAVRFNARAWATNMGKAKDAGKMQVIYDRWWKLGGDLEPLDEAIATGRTKKMIGNAIGSAEVAAAITTALPIIAALIPLLQAILKEMGEPEFPVEPLPIDPLPPGPNDLPPTPTGNGIVDNLLKNPLLLIGAAGAALYFLTKPKRKVTGTGDNQLLLLGGGLAAIYFISKKTGVNKEKDIVIPDLPPVEPEIPAFEIPPIIPTPSNEFNDVVNDKNMYDLPTRDYNNQMQ